MNDFKITIDDTLAERLKAAVSNAELFDLYLVFHDRQRADEERQRQHKYDDLPPDLRQKLAALDDNKIQFQLFPHSPTHPLVCVYDSGRLYSTIYTSGKKSFEIIINSADRNVENILGFEVVQRPAPSGGVIRADGKLLELLTDFDSKQSPTGPYFAMQEEAR